MADGIEVYIIEYPFDHSWDKRNYENVELQPISMRRLSEEYNATVSHVARNLNSILVIGKWCWFTPAQELYKQAKAQLGGRLVLLDGHDGEGAAGVLNQLKLKNPRAINVQGEYAYFCAVHAGVEFCKSFGLPPTAFNLNLKGSFIGWRADSQLPKSKEKLRENLYADVTDSLENMTEVVPLEVGGKPLNDAELGAYRKRLEEPIPDFVDWWWPQIEGLAAGQQT